MLRNKLSLGIFVPKTNQTHGLKTMRFFAFKITIKELT